MDKAHFQAVDLNGEVKDNIGHVNFSDFQKKFYGSFNPDKYLKGLFKFYPDSDLEVSVREIEKNTPFYEIKPDGKTVYYVFYKDILAMSGRNTDGELRIQDSLPEKFQTEQYMKHGFFLGTYLLGKNEYERMENETILCATPLNTVKSSPLKMRTKTIGEAVKNGYSIYSINDDNARKNYAFRPELLKVWIEDHFPQPFVYSLCYQTELSSEFPRNRILFGAPGTGKSYTIKKDSIKLLGSENSPDYERVTFHSDYSYANFVGTYKPVPTIDENGNDSITYKYVPGPFVRVLVKALRNAIAVKEGREKTKPYLLIIEEINRAHIAAVFGDVFQLLDRDDHGVSEYDIQVSEDMRDYLADALKCDPSSCERIRIPDNMFIWASMNSADQGVFPMDTAFKRRWSFKYIGVDDEELDSDGNEYQNDTFTIAGEEIEWNVLRRAINAKLSSDKIKLHEDKLMGPFFLKIRDKEGESIFTDSTKNEEFIQLFCDKVLMYLFEDAAKTKRKDLFEGLKEIDRINRYSYVCEQFRDIGIGIFGGDFIKSYYEVEEGIINNKKAGIQQLAPAVQTQDEQDQPQTDSDTD